MKFVATVVIPITQSSHMIHHILVGCEKLTGRKIKTIIERKTNRSLLVQFRVEDETPETIVMQLAAYIKGAASASLFGSVIYNK